MEIAAKPKEEVEEVPGKGLGVVQGLGKRLMDGKVVEFTDEMVEFTDEMVEFTYEMVDFTYEIDDLHRLK